VRGRLGESAGAENAIAKLKADFVVNRKLAEAINEVAGEYREADEFDKAGDLYKYVIANWPGDGEALRAQMRLVKTYNGQGNVTAAGEELNKLLCDYKSCKETDEAACEMGDYFMGHEQRARALQAYKYVVDNCPDSRHMRQALSGAAQAGIYLGNETAAQAAIERLKAGFANNEEIARDMCQMGACYHCLGQPEKANQLYSYVLSLSNLPQFEIVTIWRQTCLALSQMCQNDEAASQATLDKLCVDFPHSSRVAQALHEVAEICAYRQDYQRAGAIWQKMLERDTEKTLDRSRFLYLRGLCYDELKEYSKAIECYTEIAKDYPKSLLAGRVPYRMGRGYYYMADAKRKEQVPDEADRLYGESLGMLDLAVGELESGDDFLAKSYTFRAACYGKLGQLYKAIDDYQVVAIFWPEHEWAANAQYMVGATYNELQELEVAAGRAERAAEAVAAMAWAYDAVIENYPDTNYAIQAYKQMGLHCYEQERWAEALEYLEQWHQRQPEVKYVLGMLEECYERLSVISYQ